MIYYLKFKKKQVYVKLNSCNKLIIMNKEKTIKKQQNKNKTITFRSVFFLLLMKF